MFANEKYLNRSIISECSVTFAKNTIFWKREDCLPFSFGGNKLRKALLFFNEIEKRGNDCVVTYGTSSSNHSRIVANVAASVGIPCYIVSPEEAQQATNNSRIVQLFNSQLIITPLSDVNKTITRTLTALRNKGLEPFFIPGGGHGNLGTQAYVQCYEEILDQEKRMGIYFDYIFHASGTGTTQAGLICGKMIHADERNIVGISIARRNPRGRQVVIESVKEYMKSRGKAVATDGAVEFIDDYVLEGYGSCNDKILKTIVDVLATDGVPLDPTYTGKAFWGMLEYLRKNGIKGKDILFIHTGGTPLFFDSLGAL